MNIKNKSYMEKSEFKERQSRFEFFCVEAYEFIKSFRKDCRQHWVNLFKKPIESLYQRSFEFSSPRQAAAVLFRRPLDRNVMRGEQDDH